MLKFLHIENIAVIESCDIEFSNGFNVLTGETGAGKSIVIDSINAVLGERTSRDLIRNGCDAAEVSAVFGNLMPHTQDTLRGFDVEPDDDGNILITRRLSLSGKGFIKINGKPISATTLKEIAKNLINIHGQHDSQALLDPEKHCGFIDAVATNEVVLNEYYKEFKNLNKIRRELQALQMDEDEKQHRIELLKYQISELENADIQVGEIAALKSKLTIAEDYEKNLLAFRNAFTLFSGTEDSNGIISDLKESAKLLGGVKNETAQKSSEAITELLSGAEDVAGVMDDYLDSLQGEEIRPDEINQRLDLLHGFMLKYGNDEEAMLRFLSNAKDELETITFSDQKADELSEELQRSKERLVELGQKLTDSRKAAAAGFDKKVCEVLGFLNMPGVTFATDIAAGRYTNRGCDVVEFKICTNQGEVAKPLHKIASGGELSRIMLAIKSALLGKDSVDTVIFDEIDTGISGYAADKVGVQLKKLARGCQVICITHLAQIAARANDHLLIEKKVQNDRTETEVIPLSGEARIQEIARIMSGTEMTQSVYHSAKEMLERNINE